jgi:hypothetical protein
MCSPFNSKNWYWSIADNDSQVWSSAANGYVSVSDVSYQNWLSAGNIPRIMPNVGAAMAVVIQSSGLLDASDTTLHRLSEAIALGLTSWTAADVVAFVGWRRALRSIIAGTDTTSTSIPARPSYPSGT